MDGTCPTFTFSDPNTDHDFDFNVLSEYLFDDEKNTAPDNRNTANSSSSKSEDESDNEDFSSSDEVGEGKRSKSDDPKSTKSQDQVDRRRERNRVLARKTRLRKKFFFESLQKQVTQLAAENDMLKGVIKQRVHSGVLKEEILSQCKDDLAKIITCNVRTATSVLDKADLNLMTAIQAAQRSFVITDPSLPDNPIIFASKGFLDMCGYQLEEVLGRNCRFLQGPDSDSNQVGVMRQGIHEGVDTSVCLLNYKKDGTPYYNQVFVAALRDASSHIINYVGVQVEVKHNPNAPKKAAVLNKSGVSDDSVESVTSSSGGRAGSGLASFGSKSSASSESLGQGPHIGVKRGRPTRPLSSSTSLASGNTSIAGSGMRSSHMVTSCASAPVASRGSSVTQKLMHGVETSFSTIVTNDTL